MLHTTRLHATMLYQCYGVGFRHVEKQRNFFADFAKTRTLDPCGLTPPKIFTLFRTFCSNCWYLKKSLAHTGYDSLARRP